MLYNDIITWSEYDLLKMHYLHIERNYYFYTPLIRNVNNFVIYNYLNIPRRKGLD